LGADVIAIGRPTLWGVGAAGEPGASRVLDILEAEILRTMAVLGVANIPSITREHIRLPGELPVMGHAAPR
ncbi:MAG: alpha-hydroxy-acid oxidizing protein, partial [Alphaproteobacteria bacterium]